jgi:signal transduction histidine kinase
MEVSVPLTLSEEEVRRRKAYLEITEEDERRLREAHAHLQSHAQTIIDRFYDYLTSHEHTRRILGEPGVLDRLKKLQARYFAELTSGTYDLAYCENRIRVGWTHQRIGLSPEWYLGAYLKYLHLASEVLRSALGKNRDRYQDTIVSLTKIIYLDMGLALDAYHFSSRARIEQESQALARSNEALKNLQTAKQQLSDMIVHDLQNPLTGISAALQILREDSKKRPGPTGDVLEEALRRCKDLSTMILNVLEVSRATTGELKTLIEATELVELVTQVVGEFQAAATLEGRSIGVEGRRPLPARTDAALLKRILQNLLRNAIRHTPKGTKVIVRVDSKDAGRFCVSVIDEGPGIPPELQSRLFEPFGASALRSTGLRVDTGLGLPACQIMARALGGSIRVESDGKRGSAFTISLPSEGSS